MNAALGQAGVTLAFLAALSGAGLLAVGAARRRPALVTSGRRHVWLVAAGAVVAVVAMERALLADDFSLEFVARNSARATPLLYKVATMWSALEGSILLWGAVLALYLVLVVRRFRHRGDDPLVAWALVAFLAVTAFFFGLMLGPANPFRGVAGAVPPDGPGPNPLLQNHPLMAVHPPMLYLGYVGFTVPFAFAVGALATGRLDERWVVETRRWTLVAWGFLGAGIVLGAWWSYEVLGWGGYWAWDPVENASFLPWLTGTAYLHSALVQQRRGMLRVWNLSLLLATFSLTILGTFFTRSGVLDSVHAFTESPIGPAILALFGAVVAVGVGLIAWRGDQLRAPGSIDSPISREGAFLANNVLFAAFAFVVLLGTVFPLVAEALNGERIAVGRPYFDRMGAPVGLALLFLMAVAPALPWRVASPDVLHRRLLWPAWAGTLAVVTCVVAGVRGLAPLLAYGLAAFAGAAAVRQLAIAVRRNGWRGAVGPPGGGMVVHLGVVLVGVALAAGASTERRSELRLSPGQSATVSGHTVTYLGTRTVNHPNRTSVVADVRVDGGRVYRPALSTFPFATQAIGTPSVRTGATEDVYLTLVAPPREDGGPAVVGVMVRPLVVWLWIGGGVMAAGTALSVVPSARRRLGNVRRPTPATGDPSQPSSPDVATEVAVPETAGVGGAG